MKMSFGVALDSYQWKRVCSWARDYSVYFLIFLFCRLVKNQNKTHLPKTEWQQCLTFTELGGMVSIFWKIAHCARVRNVSFYRCEHQRYLLQPNLQPQLQERNQCCWKVLTGTFLAARRKLLHSLSPAVTIYVQVYHETKIDIIVIVIMERRKAFVTQTWEENGCIHTELNISYKQTSLYCLALTL